MKEFEKVIGYEDIKIELARIIDMMNNPKKYEKLGATTTRGLLIKGEPGLGKTLMANCFIKASKRRAFTVRKDIPDGDFVKHIKSIFAMAKKQQPSIVFLDDIDKFANEDEKHCNAEEFVTIQSCIDDCKNLEVFVLATVNDTSCLPKTLLRPGRFDKSIEVLAPNGKDAEDIINYYLSSKKVAKDIDSKDIARLLDGRSCAALETVINEAAVYAGYENKKCVDKKDLIRAFMRVVYDSPEKNSDDDSKFIRNIAVHEAGHTVVGEILEAGSINLVSVKSHDGEIGGFTSFKNDEDYFKSKQFMENRVISLLAGKAATEVVYGEGDVGVSYDIDRAFRIVERFVDDYCFGGFQNHSLCNGQVSQATLDNKQKSVHQQIENYYQQAKKIIVNNREFLDKLTDALVENKVLVYGDIQNIKASCSNTTTC